MNILADAGLIGINKAFPCPFQLTFYKNSAEAMALLKNQHILVCRSTLKINYDLLSKSSIKYMATASSGTDHVDQDKLRQLNIKLIDAKGSNASAVADYVIATLAFLKTHQLIQNTSAGIIGLGAVGTIVNERLKGAGFQTVTYDPPKQIREPLTFKSCSLEELSSVNLLCVHPELHHSTHHPTFNLIDENFLNKMPSGSIIINASRGGVVNESALLNSDNNILYCTDVYANEPQISPLVVNYATLCTPHIAGHSIEAKQAAIELLSQKVHALLKLTPPEFASTTMCPIGHNSANSWEELVLSLYNPIFETQRLKNATVPAKEFIALRQAHHYRHNFSLYTKSTQSIKSRMILGIPRT